MNDVKEASKAANAANASLVETDRFGNAFDPTVGFARLAGVLHASVVRGSKIAGVAVVEA